MSMVRSSFSDRREGYTDKAVVIRFVIGKTCMSLKYCFLYVHQEKRVVCMGFIKSSSIQFL